MEEVLSRAREREREYDWFGAVECYQKVVSLRREEICECMGHALFRVAMQAESVGEFRTRCGEAIQCYKKAKNSYDELDSPPRKNGVLRCESMIAFLRYWLASELSERRRLVKLSWKLAARAL